ncbi:3-carboxy-cis,cis-muconate cycloisomerase [Mesorhizobium sp.]|uniref:3-carboxy-cis,cis-muconate cycloisomerase n=1 Tax=Mesorhizobium sp. TaxID=1871066 RepID=UPI000FE58243|nr:3-carboxy-cis,cis-muconate cycloisomerase [Mesorhizobium sp.]RWP56446.1 MAG: 3-carboxy-cis,cis-muconate cycloisomerase [Mesorhizobium sp.]
MIAAFDSPLLSGLLGDEKMATLLGVEAELATMLQFEKALADAEGALGIVPAAAASAIGRVLDNFRPDISALRDGTARDGVMVPELVRQIRHAVGEPHSEHVHFGATSQDVIDTAMILRIRACIDLLEERLSALVVAFGDRPLMARTRMQAAIPISVADRVTSWREPLVRHHERLQSMRRSVLVIQFGGAVGTLEKFADKGAAVRAAVAERLSLGDAPQWHSQRDRIAELANWLSLVTGGLGKFGQDIALMAQAGDELQLAGGGSSSAMAHKRNPIDAEMLVTLARYNAVQLSGTHHALVHEQERSGAAWTLEWLILPQMLMAAGASTCVADRLLSNITAIGA